MSNMVPFEPFRDMMSLRDAMNRLFEESFLRPGFFGGNEQPSGLGTPVDVYETDESIVLKAAVPGINPDDIDVSITGDVLTIKGEFKPEDQPETQRNYLRQEGRFGNFCRQLTLPAAINTDSVSAPFENGILTLDMPKREEIKPKSVKITTKK